MRKGLISSILLPALLLSSCTFTSRYVYMEPNIYEVDAIYTFPINGDRHTEEMHYIKRFEEINNVNYMVRYFSDKVDYEIDDIHLFDEYITFFNSELNLYDLYKWDKNNEDWISVESFSMTNLEIDLANHGEFREHMISSKTDEYIEFHWGNKTSYDVVRVSNDDYHMCLYHYYEGTTGLFSVNRVTFNESKSEIPHFNKVAEKY